MAGNSTPLAGGEVRVVNPQAVLPGNAATAAPNVVERTPEVEARFKELASELRCLVCQNQSLADSHAGLAEDLKAKVYQQIAEGKSDSDIKTYMVDRYGEFILYKPAFSSGNLALWIGPFVILLLAVFAARSWLKGNSRKPSAADLIAQSGQESAREELERLYRKQASLKQDV